MFAAHPLAAEGCTGAVVKADCVAYDGPSPTGKQIPLKVGDILAFGKIFPPDWSYTERKNGLVRVFWSENNLGEREKMIWAPEEAIQTFDVPCKGADCAPWEGFTHHFTKEFLAHARMTMDRLGLGGTQAVARLGADGAPPEDQADAAADADIGKWRYASEVNPITDLINIYCSLDSEGPAGGGAAARQATLVARLTGTKFELYVNTHFAVEPPQNDRDIIACTVRFDKEKPMTLDFRRSSDGTGLFFLSPVGQANLLSAHGTFTIELKPQNSMPRYAVFELEGMRACLARMQRDANVRLVGN
jgi:hypothetical protein